MITIIQREWTLVVANGLTFQPGLCRYSELDQRLSGRAIGREFSDFKKLKTVNNSGDFVFSPFSKSGQSNSIPFEHFGGLQHSL
jgi:hypothetical protein